MAAIDKLYLKDYQDYVLLNTWSKINKDPFGSGTSFATFENYNCNKCIKASQPREDGTFTNAGCMVR